MKVYSLLGWHDPGFFHLIGVFKSVEDAKKAVKESKFLYYDKIGYVESRLSEKIEDVDEAVILSFVRGKRLYKAV